MPATAPPPLLSLCPACANVSLSLHCTEPQAVTPCDWRKCNEPKCQAQFDGFRGIGHRLAPERPLVADKHGTMQVPRVRMMRVGGDWRDNPLDGV